MNNKGNMTREIFIENPDHKRMAEHLRKSGDELVIPKPDFTELRVPRLSESGLEKSVANDVKHIVADKATYTPDSEFHKEYGSKTSFIYFISEDPAKRNTAAGAALNFAKDVRDYREKHFSDELSDMVILYVDAQQSLDTKIPTDVKTPSGQIKKLEVSDDPEVQKIGYHHKIQEASQMIAENPDTNYIVMVPDIDKVLKGDFNNGWSRMGRHVLGNFEYMKRDNALIIGTLGPNTQLLYGNRQVAGLNKTSNKVVNLDKNQEKE